MASDTPLTDAIWDGEYLDSWDTAKSLLDHARQMERDRAMLINALSKAQNLLDEAGVLKAVEDDE